MFKIKFGEKLLLFKISRYSPKNVADLKKKVFTKYYDVYVKFLRKRYLSPMLDDFNSISPMLYDYCNGKYESIHFKTLAMYAGALLYVQNPFDMIWDFIPLIGYVDDAAIVAYALKRIENHTKKYWDWRRIVNEALKKYDYLIQFIKQFENKLGAIKSNNADTRLLQEKFKSKILEIVQKCEEELHIARNKIVWDKLVIAFFGETSAGKSTIIDTFRILFDDNRKPNSDGLIVGDGRLDFTQDYNKYILEIDGKVFTLIDVPGIEGKEEDYKDCIKDALSQAHCVFYVNGHNKKPDVAIASKIKKYLGDWVEVHSIHNIRGDVSHYEEEKERVKLINVQNKKIGEEVTAAFQETLGCIYKGNLQVQGLLALCAKGNFPEERKSLRKSQEKLLRYFGSPEKILEFSNFSSLIQLVQSKTFNFMSEIINANNQKIISLARFAQREIEAELLCENKNIDNVKSQLLKFKDDVHKIFELTLQNINSKSKNIVIEKVNNFKVNAFKIIDEYGGNPSLCKNEINSALKKIKNGLSYRFKEICKEEFEKASECIERKRVELDGVQIDYTLIGKNQINVSGNVAKSADELKCSFADVVGTISLLSSFFLGPVGITVGVLGLVGKWLFGSQDKKKAAAKSELSKQMQTISFTANQSIEKAIANIREKINEEECKISFIIKEEVCKLEMLYNVVATSKQYINQFINNFQTSDGPIILPDLEFVTSEKKKETVSSLNKEVVAVAKKTVGK